MSNTPRQDRPASSSGKTSAEQSGETASLDTGKPSATRPKKRQRRPQEVRGRILEAALQGFARHGFEGSSTRMIAEDAHVSQSLLLYHFQSKDQLWRAVVDYVYAQNTASQILSDDIEDNNSSAGEKLRAVIKSYVMMFARLPALHQMMIQETHQLSERLSWACDNYTRRDFIKVCDLISKGQEEGEVREGNPARLRYAIVAMAAVPFSVAAEYEYLTNRNPFSSAEIENAITLINHLIFVNG